MQKSGQSLLDQQLCPDNVPMIVDRCLAEVYRRGKSALPQSGDCGQVYTITEVYRRSESLTLVIADR